MRITVSVDDALIARAQRLTGIEQRTAILREALKCLVARENARRVALLGGSQPQLERARRRRLVDEPIRGE